ncbi:hypothetical protein [Kitasatospora viridis]|uniref:Peptidase inhibitor family I36 n=1 Tax=Kitasatospora viridis TaxID=281105 RepID=A0A561TTR5_9ACTN|nr:hypothetical protein [Kitasatospora viridis]TWF90522.1 hypothetical protein FHX73_13569 [Kitasatospora viridis]
MSRKTLLRVGGLAAAASAIVLSASGLASASVSPTYVTADSSCQALEFTRVESGHDHMYVDPTIDNSSCLYGIWNNNSGSWAYLSSSPAGNQGDVYDGPGMSLSVYVIDQANGVWSPAGPAN